MIGILALQGDVSEHRNILSDLGQKSIDVRTLRNLATVDCLIIPGGESTTLMLLLRSTGLDTEIKKCAKAGMPIFGTCAGAILLGSDHLQLMDVTLDRNAYGPQIASFETDLTVQGIDDPVHVSFIRAPVIAAVGKNVEVLAVHDEQPVLVRQGHLMAATFHAELHGEMGVHALFLEKL